MRLLMRLSLAMSLVMAAVWFGEIFGYDQLCGVARW